MQPQLPWPLVRQNPWYPGQFGVSGTSTETGKRTSPTGSVFYVDPNYTGVSDNRDGTNPLNPLRTIGAALGKCQSYRGDVIHVATNSMAEYGEGGQAVANAPYPIPISEEVEVTVSGVKIVGANFGTMGVPWTPASNGGTCITVNAFDVTIEGFLFTEGLVYAGLNAISAEWNGTTLFGDNMTVRNCYFDDTVDIAIQLEFSWSCDIYNNYFQECDTYGIYSAFVGSGAAYNRICNNWFHDCAIAIAFLNAGCDDNLIHANHVYNASAAIAAAATNEGFDLAAGDDNMVTDNYFSCLLPVGVGDYNDLNSAGTGDAWVGNHCMNGLAVTNPT